MSVYFAGDLHFGHKNIWKLRLNLGLTSEAEHRSLIIKNWNSTICKKELVYVLGDVAFDADGLNAIAKLNGRKILIIGNHDLEPTNEYLNYFEEVYGLLKYKEFWLSHAPIHPEQLRGRINIHGHVHERTINDNRYINVCLENINYQPIGLERLRWTIKNSIINI